MRVREHQKEMGTERALQHKWDLSNQETKYLQNRSKVYAKGRSRARTSDQNSYNTLKAGTKDSSLRLSGSPGPWEEGGSMCVRG